MKIGFDLSLYLVTDRGLTLGRDLLEVIKDAIEGGVTMIQLREKDSTTLEFYNLAIEVKKLTQAYNIPLIINDRLDIALACDADGLHIGQSDLPYAAARRIIGHNKIIGLSVENIQDTIEANNLDVDYIGISPVFDTPTKNDTAKALGLTGVSEIVKISKHPAVGIGGINKSNARDIILSGATGVSVVSAILSATDPTDSAKELLEIVKQAVKS